MPECGYTWKAPYIYPPDTPRSQRTGSRPPERCVLPSGHEGDHRSANKVTAKNRPTELPCWICGKPKGQPPDRCPGHYEFPIPPQEVTE